MAQVRVPHGVSFFENVRDGLGQNALTCSPDLNDGSKVL